MKNVITIIFLIILSIQDIRKKEISTTILTIWGILEILTIVLQHQKTVLSLFIGIFPGVLLLLIAKISKESIGYGDGLVVLLLGIAMGLKRSVLVLLVAHAFLMISFLGMFLLQKVDKKTSIPFVPFLTIGYLFLR